MPIRTTRRRSSEQVRSRQGNPSGRAMSKHPVQCTSGIGPRFGLIALAALGLLGCGAPPALTAVTAVVAVPEGPHGVDPFTPEERLMALLTADNPRIEQVAMSLAKLGNLSVRVEAGRRLVAVARQAIASPVPWDPDDAPPDTRWLRESENDAVAPILAAMSHVGGPDVIAYCFALAEDTAVPLDRRRLAVGVLHLVLPEGEGAARERYGRLAWMLERPAQVIAAPDAYAASYTASNNLGLLVRRCFNRALSRDPNLRGTLRLTLHFSRDGRTTAKAEGTAPSELRDCIENVASGIYAPPPNGEKLEEISTSLTLLNQ